MAIQLCKYLVGEKKKVNRVTKPLAGHCRKAGVEAQQNLHEFHINAEELSSYEIGDQLTVELFTDGQRVDITSKSKGKGFQGVIKTA